VALLLVVALVEIVGHDELEGSGFLIFEKIIHYLVEVKEAQEAEHQEEYVKQGVK